MKRNEAVKIRSLREDFVFAAAVALPQPSEGGAFPPATASLARYSDPSGTSLWI
jgi:hypothetical protein